MELNVSGLSIPITMLYAGIVTILVVLLQINVIRQRVSGSVSLGDGGNKALVRFADTGIETIVGGSQVRRGEDA